MTPWEQDGAIVRSFLRMCDERGLEHMVERIGSAKFAPLILALARNDAPPRVLRAMLEEAWLMHHQRLAASGLYGARLLAIFRRARFDTSLLPEEFTAWRGVRGVDPATAAAGMSWTTHRPTACRYAIRLEQRGFTGPPLVIKRHVRRCDVVFHFASPAHEFADEVLIQAAASDAAVDGDPAEWQETCDADAPRFEAELRAVITGPRCTAQRRAVQSFAFVMGARSGDELARLLLIEQGLQQAKRAGTEEVDIPPP